MTQTAQVPAHETVFDILLEAARLQLRSKVPLSGAKFRYGAVALSFISRLEVIEPRSGRIVCRFALHNIPRRCVSHVFRMLASVLQRRHPGAVAETVVRGPVPVADIRPFTRVYRARAFSRTRVAVCGCVRIWDHPHRPCPPRRHPRGHAGRPGNRGPEPCSNGRCQTVYACLSRTRVAVCGCVRIWDHPHRSRPPCRQPCGNAGRPGNRSLEPCSNGRCQTVYACLSRTRVAVYGCVRICTVLEWLSASQPSRQR